MLFFRIFQHLLPDATAWRTTIEKRLRRFFEGLAGGPADARAFVDEVYDDLHPDTTRELSAWEQQFGLSGRGSEAERRRILDTAWKAMGGQSPHYLQSIVRAAGFDLYVHEGWIPGTAGPPGPPAVVRDPRLYTQVPMIGTVQCGEPWALCGERRAMANTWLANDPRYLVNLNLTPVAPPPIPNDDPNNPEFWQHFIYFGGPNFGDEAVILESRRADLEELLLKICPTHAWIVLLIQWIPVSAYRITLQGERRITLSGDRRVTIGA